MPEQVKLNESLGIIEVDSYGKVTKEDSLASLESIKDILKQSSAQAVLVDARRQAAAKAAAENISKFADKLPQGVKIGLIYHSEHPNNAEITFLAASAITRSVKFRMFEDRKTALEWLKH